MNVCVFGASSAHLDDIYVEQAEKVGEELARRGHPVVFGAGRTGLMGAVARGVKRAGGHLHGILPHFFVEYGVEVLYEGCDEVTYTETMNERKQLMEDAADAFIALPGGIGTFEELFEVLTLKQLGRHRKPVAVFNVNGYFDRFSDLMENAHEQRFNTFASGELYEVFTDAGEMIDFVENYVPDDRPWIEYKLGN